LFDWNTWKTQVQSANNKVDNSFGKIAAEDIAVVADMAEKQIGFVENGNHFVEDYSIPGSNG